jgi:L-amino acid N-acyltransferase YncA
VREAGGGRRKGWSTCRFQAKLEILPFNAAGRALCRKHGFREVGMYEKHAKLDGHCLDVVIVERLMSANLT